MTNKYLEKISKTLDELKEEADLRDPWLKGLISQRPNDKRIPIIHQGNTAGFYSTDSTSVKGIKHNIIDTIYISPEYRKLGLGSKAISEYYKSKSHGLAYVEPDNRASIRAFSKAGFYKGKIVTGGTSGKKYLTLTKG